ncbi:MAG: hypothetical protein ACKOPQ_14295 [Novosphingobium sp.]
MRGARLAAVLLVLATGAARAGEPQAPDKPVTDRPVTAGDVVATPVGDLGLRKDDIPPLLLAAQVDPYGLAGMRRCAAIASAIGELDAVLGEDIDVVQARESRVSAGRLAQSAVSSFIPFRGVIRELSGANAQERRLQQAIYAGSVRRAFLKGVGLERGCRYPARPATPAMAAEREAAQAPPPAPAPAPEGKRERRIKRRFISQPVVQAIQQGAKPR